MPDGCDQSAPPHSRAEGTSSNSQDRGSVLESVADIALIGGVGARSVYSYRLPNELGGQVVPGHLVHVPFGPRALQGVVLSVERRDPGGIHLRDVGGLLDARPYLVPYQLELARWISEYYVTGTSEAIGLMLPPGLDRASEMVYTATPHPTGRPQSLSDLQREILEELTTRGESTAERLARNRDRGSVSRSLSALMRLSLVSRSARLSRPSVSEVTETVVTFVAGGQAGRLTARQREVVNYLRSRSGEVSIAEMREALGVDRSTITRLTRRGIVSEHTRPTRRDPLARRHIEPHHAPPFTDEQENVYGPIGKAIAGQDGSVFLLHGVTGSGKTEVYLRAVADTLALGRQAIVMVPEIGLTPQTVTRFAGRFPSRVALLHSKLSPGERYDEWQRIRLGDCSVAVGPRSALFSPFANPGLIVLDEEHDASYKQDSSPRYHARDVAEQIARLTGAIVLLGSATPDIVSYYRARHGEFHLLSMTTRVATSRREPVMSGSVPHAGLAVEVAPKPADAVPAAGAGLPAVQVVDMRLELKAGNRSIFSRTLATSLERVLSRREQAILFLNRRGNATFVNCRDCGYVVKCRHCDIPMSYHSDGERLVCHRCDARSAPPTLCAKCGSWRVKYFGLGTQKVEQEVLRRFPRARIQRYDRDVTSGKLDHETILDAFAAGDTDILVGTQIVAKGLDFPRVTLVGAVSADTSINLPDFRASERTFSLLTQVAGRAGRAGLPGTVVIQTYTPSHFAIQAAAQHDYIAFYADEIRYRRDGLYPPFSRLVRLIRSDPVAAECQKDGHALADSLARWTEAHQSASIEIVGPAPCFTSRASDRYYWQILLRGADLHPILSQVPTPWIIDVDPMNLL